jgi:hypothetical protein
MEELATCDVRVHIAAGIYAVDIISIKDCQIIVKVNVVFSITY